MKALVVKDFVTLARSQKRALIVILAVGCYMCVMGELSFSLAYMALVGAIIGVSALTMDEQDHGMSFIMTLPPSRRMYVRERYFFAFLCGIIGIVLGTCLFLLSGSFRGSALVAESFLMAFVLSFVLMVLSVSTLIPLRLKFGGEKIVVAQTAFFFILFGVAGLVPQFIERATGFDLKAYLSQVAAGAGPAKTLAATVIAACIILFISEQISERIVVGKEY